MASLSPKAEDALEWAVKAAEAMEEAAKVFGRTSEEERLARAAYEQWEEEYQQLMEPCENECPGCPKCFDAGL